MSRSRPDPPAAVLERISESRRPQPAVRVRDRNPQSLWVPPLLPPAAGLAPLQQVRRSHKPNRIQQIQIDRTDSAKLPAQWPQGWRPASALRYPAAQAQAVDAQEPTL